MLSPETITVLVAVAGGIALTIIVVLALDWLWPPLLRREFTVELPLEKAWQHLARVEQWPSWAKHIKRVELQPAGELGLKSTGRMLLTNGLKPAWTVTEFNLYRNWIWVGDFLWLTIYYDHRFEELNPTQTKITFALEASGFAKSILGRLFAKIYSKTLDRAIALLVQEMTQVGCSAAEPDAAPDRAGITAFRGTLARHPARQVSRVVRRRRATASVPRDQIADGSLPSVCVVCGADAPHRRFPGVGAPLLAWVLFSPLIGLVTFWAYILFAGGSSGGGLPFCDRHRGYWPRRAWFIVVGFAAVVGLMVVAASLTPPAAPGKKDEPHWLFGVAGCWMLVFLPAFLVLHLSATRPTGGNRKSLVLSGASRDFVAALDVGRGHAEPGAAPDRGRM